MSEDSARHGPLPATPAAEGQTAGEDSRAGPSNPTEAASPAVPRYRILGPIGIGGMGVVYRAEDTRLGRMVALKFLPPRLTPNPREKVRFLNEARAASALDHPNICTIYEAGETAEGQLYLAMACYEGETLKRRLEHGPLSVAEALHIALQAAHGLAKAHRHGIVHRDIKPANLMITADGIVKILDFGIARLPDQTQTGPLLGTPGYMSPEQARAGAVDARSDVWSLGVVLREMLTGWRPGHGEPAENLPGETPPGLDGVLSRMLAEEPADRYPDATALLPDLAALERTATATEGRTAPPPVRRRLPAWAAALVVAAVLGVAAGLWILRGASRRGEPGPGPGQLTLPAGPTDLPGKEQFTRLTDLPGKEWFPSINPEGNFFVYARKVGARSRLFAQHVGGSKALDLSASSLEDDSQPALSPDGQQIAFRSERDDGGIFLMGSLGESVRRLTDFGFNPAWSPDGKEIVFATEKIDNPLIRKNPRSQLYRFNLTSGQLRRIHEGDAVQPSWSPNGLRIAYWGILTSGKRVIWTIPVDGGAAVPVTKGEDVDWNPVWSPDGRDLYFASDRSGVINLWRIGIDERSGKPHGGPEPVTTSGPAGMLPSISRDGKHIVYATDETRTALVKFAFEPESGAAAGPAVVTETADNIATFDVSRDGRWLVYQTLASQEDLFLIQPDGTGQRSLTQDHWRDRHPRWSPDGKRIAFYSNHGGGYGIWTIRADGSQLERAAIIPDRRARHPIWSPDGQRLACDLEDNEALIDLTRPLAERRPEYLPSPGRDMGFSASSWSADGQWLAGVRHRLDGGEVRGVVLYSLADGRYVPVTDRGEGATWLSDNRRLLYWDRGELFLLDTRSKLAQRVLTTPPGSDYNDFCLGPNDRILYLARSTEQGNIWMLTLK